MNILFGKTFIGYLKGIEFKLNTKIFIINSRRQCFLLIREIAGATNCLFVSFALKCHLNFRLNSRDHYVGRHVSVVLKGTLKIFSGRYTSHVLTLKII